MAFFVCHPTRILENLFFPVVSRQAKKNASIHQAKAIQENVISRTIVFRSTSSSSSSSSSSPFLIPASHKGRIFKSAFNEGIRSSTNLWTKMMKFTFTSLMSFAATLSLLLSTTTTKCCDGLTPSVVVSTSRRDALQRIIGGSIAAGTASLVVASPSAFAMDTPEGVDVQNFIRTGMVAQPMGVSGQAGKTRPETGVFLREGSEVNRDPRSGSVLAEILVKGAGNGELFPVLASFSSPLPLATGPLFDVECRDNTSGDSTFLAVSKDVGGKAIADLKNDFFVKDLFSPTGRFSFYGQPTDIKVKSSEMVGDDYKIMEVNFSTLSQSTQTEIPRKARVVATIPKGSSQAVMLVTSTSVPRWKKGGESMAASVTSTFKAVPAPETSLKIRAKDPRSS